MAKRIDRQIVNRLAVVWEPRMLKAFIASINKIKSGVDLKAIVEALENGDIETAYNNFNIDPRDFRLMARAIEGAFEEGGERTSEAIQKAGRIALKRFIVRFNTRNPEAEQWIADRSSALITSIVRDQREMIKEALRRGMVEGKNPRTVALNIVGTINKRTGIREGGIIGLDQRMERAANRYASNILSGEPGKMAEALTLKLRDKRYDASVRRAIRTGEPIPKKMANRMIKQYRNKALKYRGDVIARTEMLKALGEANKQSFQQAVSDGTLKENSIRRYAVTAGDERVRTNHRLIPGMNEDGVGLNESFDTPDGPRNNAPFDIQCRCYIETRVDFLAGVN